MLGITFLMLLTIFAVSWLALKLIWRDEIGLRVMGFYGCHHKTVAMGLPLINAIYEENPKVGMYVLPLLIWHPL
jgi:solute carrier family 10 (sodium/bile acid cotransporter), member 7